MKIWFRIIKRKIRSKKRGNVLGEELYANSMCKYLSRLKEVESVWVYSQANPPKEKMDFMIYMNDNLPNWSLAEKNILYLQNGYGEWSDKKLEELYKRNYDWYAFISDELLKIHLKNLKSKNLKWGWIYLPFWADLELFYPREKEDRYAFDVSYIWNDIKWTERTEKYLYPAINFNFWLFWNRHRFNLWTILLLRKYKFNFYKECLKPKYKKEFEKISKWKIPQKDVPILYSSSKINLNCTLQDCIDWNVITLRTFEVLACKWFLISDKSEIAEKELKDCVVFTDWGNDLVKKIEYYLQHPEERERIAENWYNYVKKHCNIEIQVSNLFNYLKSL